MQIETAIQEHMAACERAYELMLDENRLLKSTGSSPSDEFLDQKREALKKLETTLAALKVLPTGMGAKHRAAIQKTQQLVLKALLLDRENEHLLLKSLSAKRQEPPPMRPSLANIQKLYRKHKR